MIVSWSLVLPLALLELINRPDALQNFPWVLFGFLWVLAFSFTLVLTRLFRRRASRLGLAAGVGFLIFAAWMWGSVVVDQIPCFLGVPNCD